LIAESLWEAGKELNNIRLIKADKWYHWSFLGMVLGCIGVIVGSIPLVSSRNPLDFSNMAVDVVAIVFLFAVVLFFMGWIYEAQGAWHIHKTSEEMNSSEIEQREGCE
jgi:hypothetical protein